MSFTIKKRESYAWTVEHVISRSDGKPELMRFDAEFKALPQSKVKEISGRLSKSDLKDDTFLAEVLAGWHGLQNEDGEVFEFSEQNLRSLIELFPGLVGSFTSAWFESILGVGETFAAIGRAARKN